MTQVVVHGDTIYLCGQTEAAGAGAQTRAILAKIDTLLAEARQLEIEAAVQIWLADIRHYDEMNAIWDAWVDPANAPGQATCEARMATPRVLVEIIVIAGR